MSVWTDYENLVKIGELNNSVQIWSQYYIFVEPIGLWRKPPIFDMYLLSTLAIPIINVIVYGILLGYPDLHDTCADVLVQRISELLASFLAQKKINRMKRATDPASRQIYAKRVELDEVGAACWSCLILLFKNYSS